MPIPGRARVRALPREPRAPRVRPAPRSRPASAGRSRPARDRSRGDGPWGARGRRLASRGPRAEEEGLPAGATPRPDERTSQLTSQQFHRRSSRRRERDLPRRPMTGAHRRITLGARKTRLAPPSPFRASRRRGARPRVLHPPPSPAPRRGPRGASRRTPGTLGARRFARARSLGARFGSDRLDRRLLRPRIRIPSFARAKRSAVPSRARRGNARAPDRDGRRARVRVLARVGSRGVRRVRGSARPRRAPGGAPPPVVIVVVPRARGPTVVVAARAEGPRAGRPRPASPASIRGSPDASRRLGPLPKPPRSRPLRARVVVVVSRRRSRSLRGSGRGILLPRW